MEDLRIRTFCVDCGVDVPIDEDGCCKGCGRDAIGDAADRFLSEQDALRSRCESLAADLLGQTARLSMLSGQCEAVRDRLERWKHGNYDERSNGAHAVISEVLEILKSGK